MKMINEFIDRIYTLAENGEHQKGSIEIIKFLNSLMDNGDFDSCNDVLKLVDLTKLPIRMAMAFLTATRLIPKDKLPERPSFQVHVEKYVEEKKQCQHEKVIPVIDISDEELFKLTETQVRQRYPRFQGICPDCNKQFIGYASTAHFIAGDW